MWKTCPGGPNTRTRTHGEALIKETTTGERGDAQGARLKIHWGPEEAEEDRAEPLTPAEPLGGRGAEPRALVSSSSH